MLVVAFAFIGCEPDNGTSESTEKQITLIIEHTGTNNEIDGGLIKSNGHYYLGWMDPIKNADVFETFDPSIKSGESKSYNIKVYKGNSGYWGLDVRIHVTPTTTTSYYQNYEYSSDTASPPDTLRLRFVGSTYSDSTFSAVD
jgi:hypothetical protein